MSFTAAGATHPSSTALLKLTALVFYCSPNKWPQIKQPKTPPVYYLLGPVGLGQHRVALLHSSQQTQWAGPGPSGVPGDELLQIAGRVHSTWLEDLRSPLPSWLWARGSSQLLDTVWRVASLKVNEGGWVPLPFRSLWFPLWPHLSFGFISLTDLRPLKAYYLLTLGLPG